MADKNYINNVQDLDQIIFYTGSYSNEAASYVANRDYDKTVEGLGSLSYNSSYEIFYDKYPDVKYVEKRTNYKNLNDLFQETLSYLYNKDEGFSIGYTYAAQNRYHAIYSYESPEELDNDLLGNGEIFITRDLNDFLIGLNGQTFNKQKFYNGQFEVSSIKLDNTYYNWYPKDSVAYVDIVEKREVNNELVVEGFNSINVNVFGDDYSYDDSFDNTFKVNDELIKLVLNTIKNDTDLFKKVNEETGEIEEIDVNTLNDLEKLLLNNNIIDSEFEFKTDDVISFIQQINDLHIFNTTYYLHAHVLNNVTIKEIPEKYIIGGETGNYYSYVRNVYTPIENDIKKKISNKLNDYAENNCNNDPSIYAYYVDRCNVDVELLMSTLNFGVKQSTFKINVESRFNRWFDDTLNINAELNEGDDIVTITSYKNNEIFSMLKNHVDRVSGENVEISNKNIPHTFVSTLNSTLEDELSILTPGSIETLDLSPLKTKISNKLDLTETGWHKNNLNLKKLVLDDGDDTTVSNIEKIFGLNELSTLEYINMSNLGKLKITPAFDKLENLKVFKAKNSSIDSFRPKKGITLNYVQLPEFIKSIKLDSNVFAHGDFNILGNIESYDGVFDYTPTKNLISLTLRNIDNELSYKLVYDWYNVLDENNLLDSVIYLELQGINWTDVPVQRMINLRRFDINPNLSGEVSINGTGNYKWLTRNEYQEMIRLYGLNAFLSSNIKNGKIFKDLVFNKKTKVETFEYNLNVNNVTIKNTNNENADNLNVIKYKDTLHVSFNYYSSNGSISALPYFNRAANSLLDIIHEKNLSDNKTFKFIKGELGDYAYCTLDRSIDTSSSVEIMNIKAGDILLLNGDTLVIFFEDVNDNKVEYVKIGEITDEIAEDRYSNPHSSIANWFNSQETELRFIEAERENVIQELNITELSEDNNTIYDNNPDGINIAVDIDNYAKENLDKIEITDINVEINKENIVEVTELGEENRDGHYRIFNIKPVENYEFNELSKVKITIYCPAEKDETSVTYEVMLRNYYNPSYVEDETLVLDANMYSIEDDTLIINSKFVNAVYDESTETMTID